MTKTIQGSFTCPLESLQQMDDWSISFYASAFVKWYHSNKAYSTYPYLVQPKSCSTVHTFLQNC